MTGTTTTQSGFRTRASHLLAPIAARERQLRQLEGLPARWLFASFIIACVLTFLRGPSLFTHPQFWAEDGSRWYAQAYNLGWLHSLALPDGGYLNTLQRLGGGFALLVPFRWAPLPMAFVGLLCQALPVPILLSARCRNWASLPLRLAFALIYIAIPNAREIHVLCTNAHWHYALAEVFLAFAAAPRSTLARIGDICLFALGSVCGPFGLLLIPFVFIFWWVRRQPWSLVILGLLSSGGIVQLYFLRSFQQARFYRPLGASLAMFIRIVGGNIFMGAIRGSTPYGLRYPLIASLAMLIVAVTVCIYCARFASAEVRLFFIYCFLILAASLKSPLVPLYLKLPLWAEIIQYPSRYWFYPSLPFLFSILWCISFARSRAMRVLTICLGLLLVQGIYRDWKIPALIDSHFPEHAAAFERAAPGTHVVIPVDPAPWTMELTKK